MLLLTGWFPGGQVFLGAGASVVVDEIVKGNVFDLKHGHCERAAEWLSSGSQKSCIYI